MQRYQNLGGRSGVVAYKIGDDYIVVQFSKGKSTFYSYTYTSAGQAAIETMKQLAEQGRGLGSYISTKTTRPEFHKKGNSIEEVLCF